MACRRDLLLCVVATMGCCYIMFTSGFVASATTNVTTLVREGRGKGSVRNAWMENYRKGKAPETSGWDTISLYAAPRLPGGKRGEVHSQAGQEWLVATVLGCKSDGYFVDLAAHDYMHSSNTLMLERDFGWNGICMEANLNYVYGYTHRRCKVVVGAAGSPKDKKMNFTLRRGVSGIVGEEFDNTENQGKAVELHLVPLVDVLTEMRAPTLIDYFSLDVEGAESIVMEGFPWEKYRFSIITVERPKPDLQKKLREHGYQLLRMNSDFDDETWISTSLPNFVDVMHSWSWNCTRKRCKVDKKACGMETCKDLLTSSRSCISSDTSGQDVRAWRFHTPVAFYAGPHELFGKRGQTHSQEGEDWLVATVLGCRSGGYFVDVASNVPMRHSNSLMLERDFGWNGICIDVAGEARIGGQEFDADVSYMYEYAGRRCKLVVGESPLVIPLAEVLAEMSAPSSIDYISLNTAKGSESMIIMQDFPWTKYRFLVIIVKHPKPDLQQKLREHGYLLLRNASKLGVETWISTSLPNFQTIMHSRKWDYAQGQKLLEDHQTSCMMGVESTTRDGRLYLAVILLLLLVVHAGTRTYSHTPDRIEPNV